VSSPQEDESGRALERHLKGLDALVNSARPLRARQVRRALRPFGRDRVQVCQRPAHHPDSPYTVLVDVASPEDREAVREELAEAGFTITDTGSGDLHVRKVRAA
jgi:hypothetical protein